MSTIGLMLMMKSYATKQEPHRRVPELPHRRRPVLPLKVRRKG